MNNSGYSCCRLLAMSLRAARFALALAVTFLTLVVTAHLAHAQNFTTLATIGGNNNSRAGLVQDAAGNLYGATCCGGSGFGTVFKLDPSGMVTVLYTFTGGADGNQPRGSLVLDAADNLYGTTFAGGSGFGTVFKLDPSGTETVLYSFTGGADGAQPGGLIADAAGNLYGTTFSGGITVGIYCPGQNGCGTVFKLDTSRTEITLHSFTGQAGDGMTPFGSLVLDAAGNLYGTTVADGPPGKIFKLDPAGAETIVYSSPSYSGEPSGTLAVDAAGNIYFTKSSGSHCTVCGGSVLKLDPAGAVTSLHGFAGPPDGSSPDGLVLDRAANLFGTTNDGGSGSCTTGTPPTTAGCGTIFEIDAAGNETVLYSFMGEADGESPSGGLILDALGNIYGTTTTTVFKLAVPFSPPPPDFSLSANAFTPAAISPGASSTSSISVTALNAFSGSVSFTCSVSPTPVLAPTCSISPSSVIPGTAATLTVNTTAPAAQAMSTRGISGLFFAICLPLIGLVVTRVSFGLKQKRRKGELTAAAFTYLLFSGLIFQLACGGGRSPGGTGGQGTPSGMYTITVTGTYETGSLAHNTPVMLTVQ